MRRGCGAPAASSLPPPSSPQTGFPRSVAHKESIAICTTCTRVQVTTSRRVHVTTCTRVQVFVPVSNIIAREICSLAIARDNKRTRKRLEPQSPNWAARTREQNDQEAAWGPQRQRFGALREREREKRERGGRERGRESETSLQRETCPFRHRAVKIACPSCSVCASKIGKAVREFSSRLFTYHCTLGAKETECDQDLTWLAAGV
jgi:hypothetical protein